MEEGDERDFSPFSRFSILPFIPFLLFVPFLLSSLFLLTSFKPKHDYHVSVTQMQYNASARSFEVSIRIFTDDLEKALSQSHSKHPERGFRDTPTLHPLPVLSRDI